MAVGPVVLPTSGHAAWDDLATWWLSRYKISTQQTYATYLPRWTAWCAGRRLNPLQAGRADVERWLRTVADSGLSRASTAGHYDAVASIYRLAFDETPSPSTRVPGSPGRRCSASCSIGRCWSTPPSSPPLVRWNRPITPSPSSAACWGCEPARWPD
jgi:hypothetical protein